MEKLNVTTWYEYRAEVLKTASMNKGRVVEGAVRALGLVGEMGELMTELASVPPMRVSYTEHRDRVIKELGDVLWYTAALDAWAAEGLGVGASVLDDWILTKVFTRLDLSTACCSMAEMMKKHLGHDRPLDVDKVRDGLEHVLGACSHWAEYYEVTLSEVCTRNILKLRARFGGGGFDAAKSAAKADEPSTTTFQAPPPCAPPVDGVTVTGSVDQGPA